MEKMDGRIAAFLNENQIVVNRGTRENVTYDHVCLITWCNRIMYLLCLQELREKMSIYTLTWTSPDSCLSRYTNGNLRIGDKVKLVKLSDRLDKMLDKAIRGGLHVAGIV